MALSKIMQQPNVLTYMHLYVYKHVHMHVCTWRLEDKL